MPQVSELKTGPATERWEWLYKWTWRGVATAIWVWAIGSLSSPDSWLGRFHAVPFRTMCLAAIPPLLLYVLLKKSKGGAVAAIIFGFWIYLLTWPLIAGLLLLTPLTSAVNGTVKRAQQIRWSFLPYLLTAGCFLALASRFSSELLGGILVAAGVNCLLILVSLVTWVFSPLSWVKALLDFTIRTNVSNAIKPGSLDSLQGQGVRQRGPKELRDHLKGLVSSLRNLERLPENSPLAQDALIAFAFARKLLVSLLHLAFVFAIGHAAVVRLEGIQSYVNLPEGPPFGDTFVHYFYFALMTIISGNVAVVPKSGLAEAVTLANAVVGITLLVILVTTFSMVTRERARKSVQEVGAALDGAFQVLERELLSASVAAASSKTLDPEVRGELHKVARFRSMDQADMAAYRGILLFHTMLDHLESGNDAVALAAAMQARLTMGIREYAEYYSTCGTREITSISDVIAKWEKWRSGNAKDEGLLGRGGSHTAKDDGVSSGDESHT
jgi:hypothetical protein